MRALAALIVITTGCYHFSYENRPAPPGERLVTYREHTGTWLNGFVGRGRIDVHAYCDSPVRTGLEVSAGDVLVSVLTLLIYTPHTQPVTCPQPATTAGA